MRTSFVAAARSAVQQAKEGTAKGKPVPPNEATFERMMPHLVRDERHNGQNLEGLE